MVPFVSLITFTVIAASLLMAAREIARGQRSCLLVVFPIHFIFCGLPLLLDVVVGRPAYLAFPGFYDATNDEPTAIIYCAYMLLCLAVWWLGYQPTNSTMQISRTARTSRISFTPMKKLCVCLLLIVPFVLIMISPDPWMYLDYTPRARELHFRDAERMHHIWVGRAIQGSFLASAILLYFARHLVANLLVLFPLAGVNCWLSGKRNAIATVMVLWIYSLWRRGTLRGRRLISVSMLAAVALLAFSAYYQTRLRFTDAFVENKTREFWYDNYRIDYGRDDTIKLNIYALLHPDAMQILDYPGQSIEIVATMWMPRRLWPDKSPPYSYFVTTAAMGAPTAGSGGVTTTCLCESIANFGWLGFLLGPLLPLIVCRIGDAANSEIVRFLTLLIAIGMQTVHIAPWAVPFAVWLVLAARELLGNRVAGRRVGRRMHVRPPVTLRKRQVAMTRSLPPQE